MIEDTSRIIPGTQFNHTGFSRLTEEKTVAPSELTVRTKVNAKMHRNIGHLGN